VPQFVELYKSHGDAVLKLPPTAQNFAFSDSAANEIIVVDDFFIGVQAHPEFADKEIELSKATYLDLGMISQEEMNEIIKNINKEKVARDAKLIREVVVNFINNVN